MAECGVAAGECGADSAAWGRAADNINGSRNPFSASYSRPAHCDAQPGGGCPVLLSLSFPRVRDLVPLPGVTKSNTETVTANTETVTEHVALFDRQCWMDRMGGVYNEDTGGAHEEPAWQLAVAAQEGSDALKYD